MRLVTRRLAPIATVALLTATATAAPAWAQGDGGNGRNQVNTEVGPGGQVAVGAKETTLGQGDGGSGRSSGGGSRTSSGPGRMSGSSGSSEGPPASGGLTAGNDGDGPPAPAPAPAPPPPDPQVVAREAVLRMQIPAGGPHIGPPPQINPWKKAIVGYPLWLWTEDTEPLHQSVTNQGLTIEMTAHPTSTVFNPGDGTTVRCGAAPPRWSPQIPALTKSSCGHTYQRIGTYTLTATTTWQVTWTALGQTGQIPITRTTTTTVPVTELQAVNVGPR